MKNAFLIGNSIYLRGLTLEDINGNYFQWFNDQEICKYNSHAIFPNTQEKMLEYLKQIQLDNKQIVLAIADKNSSAHIGNISLLGINWIYRSAEFAIILGEKDFWGKGIGVEAGSLLIKHAKNNLNLRRIYCGTHQDNLAMQKLAGKLGMQLEGRRKEAIFKNGIYSDILEYGVVLD